MTEREFLTKVLAVGGLAQELRDHATEGLAKLDARNDKRKNTQTKAQKENEGIMTSILELLADGAKVASEIGVALGISTQKASALCKLLVDDGKVVVADVKVKGKGTVKQYSLASSAETDTAEVEETTEETAEE